MALNGLFLCWCAVKKLHTHSLTCGGFWSFYRLYFDRALVSKCKLFTHCRLQLVLCCLVITDDKCAVSSQCHNTRSSTLQHTVISCTTSLMKSGSALAASSTSADCSLRLCANTRFKLWPAQPSLDWSFVASFMLAVLSMMYVFSKAAKIFCQRQLLWSVHFV